MTDIVTYCDIYKCEDCPRYGDDCDGDKRVEHKDYISRADAIEAVAEEWLSEASAESPYVNDNDIDRYRELAEELFADIPSADAPKGDLISRQWLLEVYGDYIGDNGEPKYHVPLEVVRQNIKDAPSAEAEWIPCSDRLPEEKQEVYVTVYFIEGDTGRAYGYMDGFGKWHLYSVVEGTLNSGYEVIAWMPLQAEYEDYEHATLVDIKEPLKVSVVRCKDCDRGFGSPVCPIQSRGWAINIDTFYCAWGERREP